MRLSALGDVVLALPLVRTLQTEFPSARLSWIISPLCFALLEGLPGVEFIVVPKPRSIADLVRFRRRFAGGRFDVLLAAQASHRANILQALVPARRRIGFDRERARDFHHLFVSEHIRPRREHLLEGFLAFAEALGIPATKHVIEWPIPIPSDVRGKVESMLPNKPFVVIHAAATKAERNWLPERYAELARRMVEDRGLAVVLTGGGEEREMKLVESVVTGARVPVTNLGGKTAPKELAAVLERARCVISPDTAAVHIARAVGTPVVGLYAVARPEMTGPYRQIKLCVNAFPEAVRSIIHKDPDTCAWNTRVPFPEAMALITMKSVMEKVALALESPRLHQPGEN